MPNGNTTASLKRLKWLKRQVTVLRSFLAEMALDEPELIRQGTRFG